MNLYSDKPQFGMEKNTSDFVSLCFGLKQKSSHSECLAKKSLKHRSRKFRNRNWSECANRSKPNFGVFDSALNYDWNNSSAKKNWTRSSPQRRGLGVFFAAEHDDALCLLRRDLGVHNHIVVFLRNRISTQTFTKKNWESKM